MRLKPKARLRTSVAKLKYHRLCHRQTKALPFTANHHDLSYRDVAPAGDGEEAPDRQ